MAHVFISYAHSDFEFAENLKNRIEKAGFEVWMDEDKLRAGEDWRVEIDEAIKNCLALILILSPASLKSQYVIYEWSFAWGSDKKVIPVLYQSIENEKVHPRLDKRQYLNFSARGLRQWDRLVEQLRDLESQVVFKISNTTRGEQLSEDGIPELLDDLRNPDENIRLAAAHLLGKLGDAKCVPKLLLALFSDKESKVRQSVIKALDEIGDSRGIDALIEVMRSDLDSSVRETALNVVAHYDDEIIRNQLILCLYDSSPKVRSSAAYIQGDKKDQRAIKRLSELLRDEDCKVSSSAAHALSQMSFRPAIPDISRLLLNKLCSQDYRVTVAFALGELGDPAAIPSLIIALDDEYSTVRGAAVLALGDLKASVAVKKLIEMLNDTDDFDASQRVCDVVIETLEIIASQEASDAVKWWRNEQIR